MDFSKALEKDTSKQTIVKIVNYVGTDDARFSELFEIAINSEKKLSNHAIWAVNYCVEYNPDFIKDRISELLSKIQETNEDAVKRNILRMLHFVQIPEHLQGTLYTEAMKLLLSAKESVAIRVFSMQLLFDIARGIPELEIELLSILKDFGPEQKAGIRSRARRLIKNLEEINRPPKGQFQG